MDDLLALMQAGDVEALDRLARRAGPRLLAVARRACRRAVDAEDAVQQALVAATTSMRGYRGDGSAVAWLSTLVTRSCWRLNRADDRLDDRLDVVDAGVVDDVAGFACCRVDDPEVLLERARLGDAIGAALMQVPRTDRLLFLLAVDGADSHELAERFGLSRDAVRSRLKRTRQILRRLLIDSGVTQIDDDDAPAVHEARSPAPR
ncbi:MAG TPA: sigma-70 family RNA polymerase sigma factor [Myxococcota bacterium]